jgi:catechol 2,3-dioxygenase-like lactoylglutathione lyase family enzyme
VASSPSSIGNFVRISSAGFSGTADNRGAKAVGNGCPRQGSPQGQPIQIRRSTREPEEPARLLANQCSHLVGGAPQHREGGSDRVCLTGRWGITSSANGYDQYVLGDLPLMAFIPVTDLGVAQSFYGDVLGLSVNEEGPFAVVFDAGGTMLRLAQVDGLQPQPFTIAGWQVPDMETSIDNLASRGVAFVGYEGMDQDERGIWLTPGGDQVAWFKDPDGNTLSLTCFAE